MFTTFLPYKYVLVTLFNVKIVYFQNVSYFFFNIILPFQICFNINLLNFTNLYYLLNNFYNSQIFWYFFELFNLNIYILEFII